MAAPVADTWAAEWVSTLARELIRLLFLAWQAIAPAGAAVNSQGRKPLALMITTRSPVKGDTFSLNPAGTSHQIQFRAESMHS